MKAFPPLNPFVCLNRFSDTALTQLYLGIFLHIEVALEENVLANEDKTCRIKLLDQHWLLGLCLSSFIT